MSCDAALCYLLPQIRGLYLRIVERLELDILVCLPIEKIREEKMDRFLLDQNIVSNEEVLFIHEVSDEALEVSGGNEAKNFSMSTCTYYFGCAG